MGVDVVTQYQNGQEVINDSIVCVVNYHEPFKLVITLVGFLSLDFISISA